MKLKTERLHIFALIHAIMTYFVFVVFESDNPFLPIIFIPMCILGVQYIHIGIHNCIFKTEHIIYVYV